MTPQDVFTWLIAILACGAVVYFFILPSAKPSVLASPQLFVDASPTVLPNQPLQLTIAASSAIGKTIMVESEGNTRTLSCTQDPCIFSVSFSYANAGEKTISVTLDTLRAERKVAVTPIVSRCIDGTPEGECSTPPFQCENTQLISNCALCGCEEGKACVSDSCVVVPLSFAFISFTSPTNLYTLIPAELQYTIQNTSGYSADGLFLLVVSAYDASEKFIQEDAQQIQLSSLAPSDVFSGTIRAAFPSNTKFILLRLYSNSSTYPSASLLAESERVSVSVTTDTTPPLPPTHVNVSSMDGALILAWDKSPSSDVDHYRVYQQNFSSGAFTTYSIFGETTQLWTTLSSPSSPPLAYVVRSVDGAGNESEPTQPILGGAS